MIVNIPASAHCMHCEKKMRVSTFFFEEGLMGAKVNVTLTCDNKHEAVVQMVAWDWLYEITQGDIARAQGVLR